MAATVSDILAGVVVPVTGGDFKFTPDEIKTLAGFSYEIPADVEGKIMIRRNLLTMEHREIIYEVVGSCILKGTTVIIGSIKKLLEERLLILQAIKAKIGEAKDNMKKFYEELYTRESSQTIDVVFELPSFSEARSKYEADMERARKAISVIVGVEACKKCYSKNTATVQIQTRSADEPMTTITTCMACGYKKKQG